MHADAESVLAFDQRIWIRKSRWHDPSNRTTQFAPKLLFYWPWSSLLTPKCSRLLTSRLAAIKLFTCPFVTKSKILEVSIVGPNVVTTLNGKLRNSHERKSFAPTAWWLMTSRTESSGGDINCVRWIKKRDLKSTPGFNWSSGSGAQ